jgi:hypothetical protein
MTQDFAELDHALTAANLKRARTRFEHAEEGTRETAVADEQAWEEADRAGERYLAARFEHEAREAGLYVDPAVFEVPQVAVDPVAAEIRQVRHELSIYDAIVRALDDPHGALDVVMSADDPEAARAALRARYGFDDTQADAAMEIRYLVTTLVHRRENQRRRQWLLDRLHDLESRLNAQ